MTKRWVAFGLSILVLASVTGCVGFKGTPGAKAAGTFALRVNCAATEAYTDTKGNPWLADQVMEAGKAWGCEDGMTIDRGSLDIKGVSAPKIYETECYGMSGYKFTVPKGKYTVRLHFAETYDGVSAAGERVFDVSINAEKVLEGLDPFKEAGGFGKPVVKECKGIEVPDGQLTIAFEENVQNPEINGIEIIAE